MSDITKEWPAYNSIAALDPLSFDGAALALPEFNRTGDVVTLVDVLGDLTLKTHQALEDGIDTANSVAALRDLDFVAGSLVRHGAAEVIEKDVVQSALRNLASVAGTVPRGTVFTYAACNPDGVRRRSFTGTDGEELFISAVKEGVDALDNCVDEIGQSLNGGEEGLSRADEQMGRMVSAIIAVRRGITPQFFTFEMRPYFDAVTVDGVEYAGAGGAQMQVVAVDRMLWGADCSDDAYAAYYDDNVRYLTPNQRSAIHDFEHATDGKSIVTLIREGRITPDAALPTIGLLRTLKKFRYPHRKVANDNFALRSDGAVGSGQYTPTVLDKLIDLNDGAIKKLGETV